MSKRPLEDNSQNGPNKKQVVEMPGGKKLEIETTIGSAPVKGAAALIPPSLARRQLVGTTASQTKANQAAQQKQYEESYMQQQREQSMQFQQQQQGRPMMQLQPAVSAPPMLYPIPNESQSTSTTSIQDINALANLVAGKVDAQRGTSYQDVLKQTTPNAPTQFVFPHKAGPNATQNANNTTSQSQSILQSLKRDAEQELKSGGGQDDGSNLIDKYANVPEAKFLRAAAGKVWEDPTLADWPENGYRIWVGDLGNEVNDEILGKAFIRYTSFQRARVVRDKRSNKTKGYGFVQFGGADDFLKAVKEMHGRYIGNRPCRIKKADIDKRAAINRPEMVEKALVHQAVKKQQYQH